VDLACVPQAGKLEQEEILARLSCVGLIYALRHGIASVEKASRRSAEVDVFSIPQVGRWFMQVCKLY
jgi:hypothetical protein